MYVIWEGMVGESCTFLSEYLVEDVLRSLSKGLRT